MGLDANTVIWLGVRTRRGRSELYGLLKDLPEEVYDELQKNGEVEFEGLKFREFNHADEPVGFGTELLDQGWREGSTELDLVALNQKVQEMIPKVKLAFAKMMVTAEPKVWLATNLP